MSLLPNVAGHTMANWQFQGNLLDSSGNGLHLQCVDWGTPGTAIVTGGTEQYASLGGGLSSFLFDGATKLVAPATPLLRMLGPYTIQFLLNLAIGTGGNQVFVVCADPTRFGGVGGGANLAPASLFSYFYSNDFLGTLPYYGDKTHVSLTGGCFHPQVNGFGPYPTAWGVQATALYTLRHNADHTIDMFYNAEKRPCSVSTVLGVSNGTERFWIGGCDSRFNDAIASGGKIAGYRVVDYPRSDAEVTADVIGVTSPPLVTTGGGIGAMGPAVTAELYRYAPKGYGDRWTNPEDV